MKIKGGSRLMLFNPHWMDYIHPFVTYKSDSPSKANCQYGEVLLEPVISISAGHDNAGRACTSLHLGRASRDAESAETCI